VDMFRTPKILDIDLWCAQAVFADDMLAGFFCQPHTHHR
jgi:hypothetical protein